VTQHHHAVASFDRIVVIFNPQSTADGPQLADELRADLTKRLPEVPARLCPTDRAGHARDATSPATPRRPDIR
jgi:diacylglycerol kinase (ATP)